MIPLNEERRLGRKSYLLLIAEKVTPAAAFLLIAVVALVAGELFGPAIKGLSATASLITAGALIVAIILFCVGLVVARLQYANYTFTMEEFDLKLRRGILSQHETSIPYRNIQSVDVTRSFLYRMCGLSRLTVISAGHDDPGDKDDTDTVFDPIDRDLADEVRLDLERKIGVQVTESEKEADTQSAKGPVLSGPML